MNFIQPLTFKCFTEPDSDVLSPLRVLDRMGGSPFFCRSFSRSRARLSLEYDRDDFLLRSLERDRDRLRCLRLREPERDLDLLLLGDLQRETTKTFSPDCLCHHESTSQLL